MKKTRPIIKLILIVVICILIWYLIELYVGNFLTSQHFNYPMRDGHVLRINRFIGIPFLVGRQFLLLSSLFALLFFFLPTKSKPLMDKIIKLISIVGLMIILIFGVAKSFFFLIGGEGRAAALELIITWFFRIMALQVGYYIGTRIVKTPVNVS